MTCYSSLPGKQSVVLLGMVLWKVTALQMHVECTICCIGTLINHVSTFVCCS